LSWAAFMQAVPCLQAEQGYSLSGALGQGAGSGRSTASSDVAQTAAEAKQKAAKMFQAGTQWFMRAGKNLVKDLQGRQGSIGYSSGSQHRVHSQQQANGGSLGHGAAAFCTYG